MSVLSLNVGSSSVKFALFDHHNQTIAERLIFGSITDLRTNTAALHVHSTTEEKHSRIMVEGSMEHRVSVAISNIFHVLTPFFEKHPLIAVGHRVVHGGLEYQSTTAIASKMLESLEHLITLAPLHEPYNLIGIHAVAQLFPKVKQVACFDTAFHAKQPRLHRLYGLPRALSDEGLIRYGFHGLSYEYLSKELTALLGEMPEKVIMAHLGSGASICALKKGVSVGSSLGFSTLDGLLMSTRPGQLDAGVILHLLQEKKMALKDIHHMLYHESGLKGVSGISAEMHELITLADESHHEKDKAQAQQAIDLFCHRASTEMASWLPALCGLSTIVFSGGIGENAPSIRRKIAQSFAWLGAEIDEHANQQASSISMCISKPTSSIQILVIPTDEEKIIAENTLAHRL